MTQDLVSHVSDTARWVAVHRALETQRPDALFRDLLAEKLAGDRGRRIAAAANVASTGDDWFLTTRTKLIDDQIKAAVAAGCDTVINLGAGLDARPYRMVLPADLSWIEVDLAGLIEEKNVLLMDESASCQLTRVAVDVTDLDALTSFLDDALAGVRQALIISEGLVMYLQEVDVVALANALHRPEIAGWCLDFSSAGVANLVADRNDGLLKRAPWTFLPENGIAYFEDLGWEVDYLESMVAGARRFGRLSLADGPEPDPRAPGVVPFSAVALLR